MTRADGRLRTSPRPARGGVKTKATVIGYPPYDVEIPLADDTVPKQRRITLAVDGFLGEDSGVTVADGARHVRGEKPRVERADYLRRGFASRGFERTFALVNGVEVREAVLQHRLLAIELERSPHERRPIKVSIRSYG